MATSERLDEPDAAAKPTTTEQRRASIETGDVDAEPRVSAESVRAALARSRRRWGALSYPEAREVYLLKDSGISASKIGRMYGVPHGSVLAIWRGHTYWKATADLRAESESRDP